MTASGKTKKKPRFIKPPNILKQKMGSGGIDEKVLAKSQEYLETIAVDFVPIAEGFLREFSLRLKEARESDAPFAAAREKIVMPVMQLKANGGMFRFQLVSEVADIALQFLEAIDETKVNDDTFEVLKAHENTIKIIISNNLKGNGGKEGLALVRELDHACKRYFSRYKTKK